MLANGHTGGANNVPQQNGANRRSDAPEGYLDEHFIRYTPWLLRVQELNRQYPGAYVQISNAMQDIPDEPPTTPVEVGAALSALDAQLQRYWNLYVRSRGLPLLGPGRTMTAIEFHTALEGLCPGFILWPPHDTYSMALQYFAVPEEDESTGSSEVSPTRVNGLPNGVDH